jgi:sugar lactone lactonase YvrE
MRLSLGSGITIIVLFAVLCLGVETVWSKGVGDGGPATRATVYGPTGLALDENYLYIVESMGGRVRRVNLKTSVIMTIAGGGRRCVQKNYASPKPGCLGYPQRVAVDGNGAVYVTDEEIAGIIKVGAHPHTFSIVAAGSINVSSDSGKKKARLKWPDGIVVDGLAGLFFSDMSGQFVYRLAFHGDSVEIIAGTGNQGSRGDGGPAREAEFGFPEGLAKDVAGNLFVADSYNCRIQRIDSRTGIVTTVAEMDDEPTDLAVDQNGDVFFAETWSNRVQRIDATTGRITTVAGNGESGFSGDGGPATKASLHFPKGIAVDKSGNLYISDSSNGRVRRVDARSGTITTVAGKGPILPDLIL